MAYFLKNVDLDAYVAVPSTIIGGAVGDYIEFDIAALAGNNAGVYRLVGEASGFNNFFDLRDTEAVASIGGVQRSYSTGYSKPAVGVRFTVRFVKSSVDNWDVILNGVSLGEQFKSGNFTFDQFLRHGASSTQCTLADLYKVTVKTGATTRVYDPSLSNGTGSTLPTNDGLNQGTLTNFPVDDSQWVVLTLPPSVTVTQATLTPGGTISGTYADYATIPTTLTVSDGTNIITIASPTITDNGDGTGSFSGTMPALPTTGTANLVLFGDVTVELS